MVLSNEVFSPEGAKIARCAECHALQENVRSSSPGVSSAEDRLLDLVLSTPDCSGCQGVTIALAGGLPSLRELDD